MPSDHVVVALDEALHQRHQDSPVFDQIDVGLPQPRAEFVCGDLPRVALTDDLSEGHDELRERAFDDLDEQLLLRTEHAHDVGLADAGGLGDLLGRGACVAGATEDGAGVAQNQLSPLGGRHAFANGALGRGFGGHA